MNWCRQAIFALLLPLAACSTPSADQVTSAAEAQIKVYDVRDIIGIGPPYGPSTYDADKARLLEDVEKRLTRNAELRELNTNLIIKTLADDHQRISDYLDGRREQRRLEWERLREAT